MESLKTFSIIIIIFLISCSEKKTTSNLLPDSTIVNFQADLMIVQEENQFLRSDSLVRHQRMDSLYTHYNITKEQVEETLDFYRKDINRWKQFYESVMHRLESLQRDEIKTPIL